MTTYTSWKAGDTINICASLSEFCGSIEQFIRIYDINVTKSPDVCTLNIGTGGNCGLHLNNVELTFSFVKGMDGVNCSVAQTYKILGSVRTVSNGTAGVAYTVTEQDRLDSIAASNEGYSYYVMVCITNSDGQVVPTNISEITAPITISQNLCLDVPCPDKCYGSGLWSMKCDPPTGACVQDVLKQANSPLCSGTHYIEYDFSFLPQSFLDLISSNIVDLSNWLGTHLPIPGNIQWMGATYSGGRFKIYVIYTPPSSVTSLALPAMAISTFAGLIAGLIVFAVAQRLTSVLGPLYSMIIGAALGIVGGLTLSYTIYEFSSGTSTPGTAPSQTSVDKSKNIDEYIKNYVKPFCDQQYPGCATVPATCDGPTYRTYVACVQQVAQCQYDAALKGDPVTTCDPRVQEYTTIDTGLADGTMTVAEAQQRTITNNTTINEYHDNVVQTMTCPSGQTYDPTTQKCVQAAGDCWIAGLTPGSCILTAKTGKTIAIIGGVVIGGYLVFSLIKK